MAVPWRGVLRLEIKNDILVHLLCYYLCDFLFQFLACTEPLSLTVSCFRAHDLTVFAQRVMDWWPWVTGCTACLETSTCEQF